MHTFDVPAEKRLRVILSTDAKNEADDQFALAYALMSPKLEIAGIAAAHFAAKAPQGSVGQSYEEIQAVLGKMGMAGRVPVLMGAPCGLAADGVPQESEAARFIVQEAGKEGPPLYVASLGAITDLASAYLIDPSIEGRVTSVWLGGGPYPRGGSEFNLMNDIRAANTLLRSQMAFWQIPVTASACMRVGFAELLCRAAPCGEIGDYLVRELMEVSRREAWANGEDWVLWDMAAIALLLDPHPYQYHEAEARLFGPDMAYGSPVPGRRIRIYDRVEPRYTMEDFFAKLALHSGRA